MFSLTEDGQAALRFALERSREQEDRLFLTSEELATLHHLLSRMTGEGNVLANTSLGWAGIIA